jgi:hypothetical protein
MSRSFRMGRPAIHYVSGSILAALKGLADKYSQVNDRCFYFCDDT